jgi:hypothetical protein
MRKYREARDLCDKMTRRFPERRLNCEQILARTDSWALNRNEFDASTELKRVPNLNLIQNSIVYTFLTAGLLCYNFLRICLIS